MPLTTAPPATDLYLPRPVVGAAWDPHTIHTYYFGFSIPEERMGCFIYVRCQPTFGVCGSGVSIFRGTDNHTVLDAEHLDYEVVSQWPEITGNVIRNAFVGKNHVCNVSDHGRTQQRFFSWIRHPS